MQANSGRLRFPIFFGARFEEHTQATAAPERAADTEEETEPTAPEPAPPPVRRTGWWLDVLLFFLLCVVALPVRFANTSGDFWQDEADYALASTRGFQTNRWDIPDTPRAPDSLIVLRHFHPPMTVHVMEFARQWGHSDRLLRSPFVLAGALSVGLVYLCALSLFPTRREIGVACAIILIVTPPHIRAASHALPWSLIILGLLLLLWTLLEWVRTRHIGWIIGAGIAFGFLFVTSEMFFPALLALLLALPLLLWPEIKMPEKRARVLKASAVGIVVLLALVFVFWPQGLLGGALKNLLHYVKVSGAAEIPAQVGKRVYVPAPKWAYLYWYWNDYRPFFTCYALGTLTALVLLARRRLTPGAGVLLILTAVLLFSAHRAHIIGPEYLAHCLPPLTLIAGWFFWSVSRWNRTAGALLMGIICVYILHWTPHRPLAGMDARAQISRWPNAARFLASQWQPNDTLLIGPQTVGVARWYLLHDAGISATEAQIQPIPIHSRRREAQWTASIQKILAGRYRFVVVSSAVSDHPTIDPLIQHIVQTWPVLYRSEEDRPYPPRLTIYQIPPGVSEQTPLPMPGASVPLPNAAPASETSQDTE